MTKTDVIGFIGVAILLIAYFLNLVNKVKNSDFTYLIMNLVGAGTSCFASVLLHYLPFIILEASWTLVSAIGLFTYFRKAKKMNGEKTQARS
jgi:hypothetical protein